MHAVELNLAEVTPLLAPLDSEDLIVGDADQASVLAIVVVIEAEQAMFAESLVQLGMDLSTDIPPTPLPFPPTAEIVVRVRLDDTVIRVVREEEEVLS